MQTKTILLAFPLAAILSVSLVSMIEMPQAMADKDDKSSKKFHGLLKKIQHNKPHFETDLTSANTIPLVENDFSGKAKAWLVLDDGKLKLKYWIKTDMDLNPGWAQTPESSDDITKIHLHNNMPGMAGMHVLNVYKAPSQDDDDLVLKPSKGVVKGLWDDADANDVDNSGTRTGPDSVELSSMLGELCEGNIYANIHGTTDKGDDDTGSLRGNLDPTDKGEKICKVLDKLGLLEEVEHGEHTPHS